VGVFGGGGCIYTYNDASINLFFYCVLKNYILIICTYYKFSLKHITCIKATQVKFFSLIKFNHFKLYNKIFK